MIATVSQHYVSTESGIASRLDAELDANQFQMRIAVLLIAWMVSMVSYFLGALYTVLRPRRGLQDLVVGTHLVPR